MGIGIKACKRREIGSPVAKEHAYNPTPPTARYTLDVATPNLTKKRRTERGRTRK